MRPKLTQEEIAALKKSVEMEDLPDDNPTVRSAIRDREDALLNAHEPIESAEPGDRLWMTWPTGHIVQCTVVKEVEDTPPKYYEVSPAGNESNVTMPAAYLYKTQRACMLGSLEAHLREFVRFAYQLKYSFTGVRMENTKDRQGQPAKYKVGDTVWYREPKNDYKYHNGTVTFVEEETDFWDAEFMPYTYHVESKNGNTTFHRKLTSDRVFGSRNEVILDIINDKELQLTGAIIWFADLRGTTETEEDVPDDYEAVSL